MGMQRGWGLICFGLLSMQCCHLMLLLLLMLLLFSVFCCSVAGPGSGCGCVIEYYTRVCALRMPGPRAITHDRHTQQARGAARAVRGAHALSSRVLRGYVVVIEVLNFSAQDVVLRCFKYLNAIREYIIGFLYAISDELQL